MSRLNQFLAGIKVVDLSRHLPGPLASMLLADMGATVIKVEPPYGDELRDIGPRKNGGNSLWFEAINAGKSGIKLDLKSDDDRDSLIELIAESDVVIESFRPGVMEKLGISIASLKQRFPHLVICSLNGYGENTPLKEHSGHDINYLAKSGVLSMTGTEHSPITPWPPIADSSAGLFGICSILGALFDRERNGSGCHIEVALADAALPLISFSLAELSVDLGPSGRAHGLLNGGSAQYTTYTTQDCRNIALGALEPKFWRNFCNAADHSEWIARASDPLPQRELRREIGLFFNALTLEECDTKFAAADCCYSEVLDLHDAVKTQHSKRKNLLKENGAGGYDALFPAYVDGQAPAGRTRFTEVSLETIFSD